VIIAVGYRVNSREATQFLIWATQVLREYLIKGFAMDDECLKQGPRFGKVSHEVVKALAEGQYETFRVIQDRSFEGDFEREAKKLLGESKRTAKRKKKGD
jgi:hypothetical protein